MKSGMRRRALAIPQTALVAAVGAVMILFVTVLASRVAVFMDRSTETALIQRLGEVYLDGLSAAVAPHAIKGHEDELRGALERVATYYDGVREVRIVVRDLGGDLLGDLARDERAKNAAPPATSSEVTLTAASERHRVWVQRPLIVEGRARAILSAQLDLQPVRDERREADVKSLAVNAVLAIVFTLFGFHLIRLLLRPLKLLEEALSRAASGEPRQIDVEDRASTSPRVRHLLQVYNRMVTALEERRQMQIGRSEQLRTADLGRLAATVAHEVRNPLAGMFNAVDTARRFIDNRDAVIASLDLLERGLSTIGRVVDTTLSFHRSPPQGKPLDAIDLDDLEQLIRPVAERRGIRLDWTGRIVDRLPLDGAAVRQIVLNLALNAVNAARPRGRVGVEIVQTDRLVIRIGDDGEGLAPLMVQRLRTLDLDWIDTSEGGIGLGVVVRAVASLGGGIDVERCEAPPSTTVVLCLPIPDRTREAEDRSHG